MKSIKFIALSVVLAVTLTAFIHTNWEYPPTENICSHKTKEIEPPTLVYNLSTRAKNTLTKERMHNAKTISDLIPDNSILEEVRNNIISLRAVKIRIDEKNAEYPILNSQNKVPLNQEQLNLIKSIDYSDNFFLEGYFTQNTLGEDFKHDRFFNYHITVVSEQQASYKAGRNAFIDFLSTECQSTINKVQNGNLAFGKIRFTVTTAGTIANAEITSSCGYTSIDERMLELMHNLPEDWNVATNSNGEKVNQTLYFSYGEKGC